MWIVMKHRHRATDKAAPIMESSSYGPFDNKETAIKHAMDRYGGAYSYSVHEVFESARDRQ